MAEPRVTDEVDGSGAGGRGAAGGRAGAAAQRRAPRPARRCSGHTRCRGGVARPGAAAVRDGGRGAAADGRADRAARRGRRSVRARCCRCGRSPAYRLLVTTTTASTRRRPVPLPAGAGRTRPAPDLRGPARAAVDRAGRAAHDARRGDRHPVRRVGAERPRGAAGRRLHLLGRHRASRCARWARPACGSCSCPGIGEGTLVQVRDHPPGRHRAPCARTRWRAAPRCPPATASSCTPRATSGGTRSGWRAAADGPLHRGAVLGLRGAPAVLAARA